MTPRQRAEEIVRGSSRQMVLLALSEKEQIDAITQAIEEEIK